MLLTTYQLNLEAAADAVVVEGIGVAANPQVGEGTIAESARGGARRKRKPDPRRRRDYWTPHLQPVVVPPINVVVKGTGCAARLCVGTGSFSIGVDLHPDELLALLAMASDETRVGRKMRILQRAVESGYSQARSPCAA